MSPGSCPSRPHASPASQPFRTTTMPWINWAPCKQPGLSLPRQKTPPPTLTSSAGKHTPHLPPFPLPSLLLSPLLLLPSPPPPSARRPPPLPLLHYPFLPHPFCLLLTSLIHHPPPLRPSSSPFPFPLLLPSSAPHGPLPSRPRKRRPSPSSPSPSPSPRHHTTQPLLGMTLSKYSDQLYLGSR